MTLKHAPSYFVSFVALIFALALVVSTVVLAAPTKPGGSVTPTYIGNDISWPQCGSRLPTNHAFGIVGVNGGLASNVNPCLSTQLAWANKAPGTPNQPKVQLYVNTANPGQIIDQIKTWPTNNVDPAFNIAPNPHGDCDGTNSLACSWQYGWNRSVEAAKEYFVPAANRANIDPNPQAYTWWLDVETENSWQTGSSEALAKNVATIEAMATYYQLLGAKVGLYSTSYQWGQIVGTNVGDGSILNGLDSWLPGARSLTSAKAKCTSAPLTTGGKITLTQYISKNLDYNYSCVQ